MRLLRSPGLARALSFLVLGVAVVAVHHGVFRAGFIVLDDPLYVTRNPEVKAGLTASGVAWAFTTFHAYNWHPLTWLSHMLDVQVFGLAPAGHHLVNLLFHAASTVLLWSLLERTTGARWRSLCVAVLFAIHPLHVESVAWVAERKDVLSGLLALLTLWFYADWVARGGIARYAGALGCFALGLMAKPMIVTWPVVLLLFDLWPLRRLPIPETESGRVDARGWGRLLLEKVPFFALSAASSVVTWLAQHGGGAVIYESRLSLNAGNAILSYLRYLAKTFWPIDLAVIYPFRPESVTPAAVGIAAGVLSVITVMAFAARRDRPWLLAGWGWYLVTLLPVVGFIRIGTHAIADRYTYLPLIGIFVVSVWGLAEVAEKARLPRWASTGAAVTSFVLLAGLTIRQERTWRSSVMVFEHAVAVTYDNALAHTSLGLAYGELRDATRAAREGGLGRMFNGRDIVKLLPDSQEAHYRLANAYSELGRFQEAIESYRAAIRLEPSFAKAHNNLGIAYARLGRIEEAYQSFARAVRLDPTDASARDNLQMMERAIAQGSIRPTPSHAP